MNDSFDTILSLSDPAEIVKLKTMVKKYPYVHLQENDERGKEIFLESIISQ